jgi:hypothetical protein
MPILNDFPEHKAPGREFRSGKAEGVQAGELTVLRRMIVKRFGACLGKGLGIGQIQANNAPTIMPFTSR